MTTVSGITNSQATYLDDTGLSQLPNTLLQLVFEYGSSSLYTIFSKVCPRWEHCEKGLAPKKWAELKERCADCPRMIERINKIEKRYFSEEAASWLGRLDERMERALRLNGAHQEEIAAIRRETNPEKAISVDTLVLMERRIIKYRDQALEKFWYHLLHHGAPNLRNSDATEIRPWLKDKGNIDNPQIKVFNRRMKSKYRGIPPELTQFISFEVICLDGNNIASIPSTIGRLSRLRYLDLHDNKIEKLPPSIGDLPLLKLDLRGNPLRTLPAEITRLFEHEAFFILLLDKEQFVKLYDQLNKLYPETVWYQKLFNTLLLFFAHLFSLFMWMMCCESDPLRDLSLYTLDEIKAFDNKNIQAIELTSSANSTLDTFFSERRFHVRFAPEVVQ